MHAADIDAARDPEDLFGQLADRQRAIRDAGRRHDAPRFMRETLRNASQALTNPDRTVGALAALEIIRGAEPVISAADPALLVYTSPAFATSASDDYSPRLGV